MNLKFARRIFLLSGIYGVLVLAPLFFLEGYIAREMPPAINHPEFYYGFVCLALASQGLYFLVASDVLRFRPVILVGVAGKLSFALAVVLLYLQGRTPAQFFGGPIIDVLLALLFLWVYFGTAEKRTAEQ
jgi:hypothetical protein